MITLTKEQIKEAVVEYIEKRYNRLGLNKLKVSLVVEMRHPEEAGVTLKSITAVAAPFEPCSSCSTEHKCLVEGCYNENN